MKRVRFALNAQFQEITLIQEIILSEFMTSKSRIPQTQDPNPSDTTDELETRPNE